MAALRSFLFLLVFYGGTVLYVLAGVAALAFGRRGVRAVANAWARFHRACAGILLGIRVRIEGEVPQGGVLIAAKHEAMFETLELTALLDDPAIVKKNKHTHNPVWG